MNGQFGGAKLVKEIHFSEGRKKLIEGINELATAVGSTLGASGRTVVIENDFGGAHITKDGVTVAESIQVEDAVKNLGMTMLKQAAKNTASKAGDGTTTSTILAQALIQSYEDLNKGFSFRDIKRGIDSALEYTINQLDRRAVKVDEKRLENVSIISANGDQTLGKLIADAFKKAGDNGIVTHQASGSSDTYVESVEGTHIKSNSTSHHFFTNPEKELCELDNPLVFLCATSIPNVRRIQSILEYAIKQNRSILLIAELESQPTAALAMNKVKGNIKAKKEGILPGGGAALHYVAANNNFIISGAGELVGWDIFREALYSPFNTILKNAGLDPMDKKYNVKKWGLGVDVTDGKVKDMRKAGIIDPVLVTKSALKNAVSVAMTILSTDCVISNIRE